MWQGCLFSMRSLPFGAYKKSEYLLCGTQLELPKWLQHIILVKFREILLSYLVILIIFSSNINNFLVPGTLPFLTCHISGTSLALHLALGALFGAIFTRTCIWHKEGCIWRLSFRISKCYLSFPKH